MSTQGSLFFSSQPQPRPVGEQQTAEAYPWWLVMYQSEYFHAPSPIRVRAPDVEMAKAKAERWGRGLHGFQLLCVAREEYRRL